jgi:hypothetical protein
MNTGVQSVRSVRYTVELMTHRATGTTYVVLGEAALAPDGTYVWYDIFQAAGPLEMRELRAIRQNPLHWQPDAGLNLDRLMQTMHEYALDTVVTHA